MEVVNSEIKEKINIREIYRYLGYGTGMPGDDIQSLVKEVTAHLVNTIKPKNIYKIYDCSTTESGVTLISDKTLFLRAEIWHSILHSAAEWFCWQRHSASKRTSFYSGMKC